MNQPLPAREPLITVATVTAAVTAILALLTAFGIPLSEQQQTAILGVVAVAAPLAVGLLARSQVTPNAKVVEVDDNGVVRAGEASDVLAPGDRIRTIGSGDEPGYPMGE